MYIVARSVAHSRLISARRRLRFYRCKFSGVVVPHPVDTLISNPNRQPTALMLKQHPTNNMYNQIS
jgi:hypothetical protein